MLYTRFTPTGKSRWAVSGMSTQIAEVTVGAHCAITQPKATPSPRMSGRVWRPYPRDVPNGAEVREVPGTALTARRGVVTTAPPWCPGLPYAPKGRRNGSKSRAIKGMSREFTWV